jgi:hypothetical protein
MSQNSKSNKVCLIIDDFKSKLLYKTVLEDGILDFVINGQRKTEGSAKKVPVDIDNTYLKLYKDCPDDYKELFACFHQKLNSLFDFMNSKISKKKHFNAEESRELLKLIKTIKDFSSLLKKEGIIIQIDDYYDQTLKKCDTFLNSSGGSTIPEDFQKINITKYDPIFLSISSGATITERQASSIKDTFNSEYMRRQIEQMVEAIEKKHPSDAIGKAKEVIESCCKAILSEGGSESGVENLDKLDIQELIKNVKEKLELKSEHQAIKQTIGGLSSIAIGIAQLRNAKGTGHGKNAVKFKDPSVIEARLSVDSAIALIHFCWELHKQKPQNRQDIPTI